MGFSGDGANVAIATQASRIFDHTKVSSADRHHRV